MEVNHLFLELVNTIVFNDFSKISYVAISTLVKMI